jgi:hypothetical protein
MLLTLLHVDSIGSPTWFLDACLRHHQPLPRKSTHRPDEADLPAPTLKEVGVDASGVKVKF